MKTRVLNASDFTPEERKKVLARNRPHYTDSLIASLDGTYYKIGDVADMLGMSTKTIQRLIHNEELDVPSKILRRGQKWFMYLFTEEDVEKIRQYYQIEE